MRRHACLLSLLLLAPGCSNRPPAGPTDSGGGPPFVSSDSAVVVTGRIVSAIDRAALPGLTITGTSQVGTSDADGRFSFQWGPHLNPLTLPVVVAGPTIVPRSVVIDTSRSREVEVDAIPLGNGFDLDYYRRLARGALSQPTLQSLRRWTRAPSVYIRTVDERGEPVPAGTMDLVSAVVGDEVLEWTGGRFGLATVERGPETREGMAGWVTIKWSNPRPALDRCGLAQVGVEGGWIELNPLLDACGCDGSRIGAGIVRHEMAHALGFFHTNAAGDLLVSRLDTEQACHGRISSRERLHAAIAYSRPVGNRDPDTDPVASVMPYDSLPVVILD